MKSIFFLLIFFTFSLNAKELTFKSTGKLIRNEVTEFPDGGKFISFKHEGGFETNIGKYGRYQCNGSILYNKQSALENMFFACRNIDQNGDIFISMGKRKKGSDLDRAVGQTNIIDAEGFWKNYIGYKCTYSVVYVEEIVFSPVKCKN
ncbi:MAG: hypothetical protein CFH34_01313 [Alphaproteobacteria bacterium MarineAlpha9_Bin4]|nr:hypothetical protein [Pelagibacterales bacterium]PPR25713.1 MAG: hypothetical protein CFH34_01313 [Alphaproteobacteria bacterium MarineAlpha9_Bin4]|tara:strand:+ start:104 stop:547 length:444 start_codon:yes stop_codon:yes gene_type:complete